jgi:hypothetical protein
MRFEDALPSLTSNGQARLTEQQRSQRGRPEEPARPSHPQAMRRPRAANVLVPRGSTVGSAETESGEPFQRVRHRRADGEGASPPLADESTAASLPTAEDARREVEADEQRPPRWCRVARAPRERGAVSWWPSHSPDIPHALGRDGSDRCGQHRPHARSHHVEARRSWG